jgi:hypothetical protein
VLAFPEPERLAEAMVAAGFDAVTWTPLTAGVSALHVGDLEPAPRARRTSNAAATREVIA